MNLRNKKLEINIGVRMRELRKELNLSQSQLGKKLGLEKSTISSYETGARTPTAHVASNIARCLGVSLDYLCGLNDERYKLVITPDVELDLTRLNPLGVYTLCNYYRFLVTQEEFAEKEIK